ncbi:MAG: HAD-IIIC family phosphatase [Planctomycetales bacterium]|nr:HAD-IIIC family phosphatase [Planctomycetales bacterium]
MTLDTSSTGSSVVIAATFTAEPIALPLWSWWRWLESPASLRFAPYHQVFQQLLDPHSLLSTNRAGTNILLVRIEDWCQAEQFAEASRRGEEFIKAVEQFITVAGVSGDSIGQLLVCFCPSSATQDSSTRVSLASIESELIASLTKLPRVIPIASCEATELYPVSEVEDSIAKRAGQIPYTQAYYTALASLLARRLFVLRQSPAKVIVLDCDQTLWDGVCGEVGWREVIVSQERQALQRSLLQLRDMGYLLCLCSKNNADDAWQVFEQHPDMLLRREHFAAVRLNWSAKSQSLRELAEQLNLGLDSFVFIDDSPLECAEVRAHLPQVLTLQLPESSGSSDAAGGVGIANFLQHVWALDHLNVTDEDRQRAERYTQELRRGEAREQDVSLEQFLSKLNLQVNFLPLSEERLERGAQLTQRTNQFNFTTRRRTAAELRQWCAAAQTDAFMVDASDRFGRYGLVGLVLYELEDATLRVDSLMLSCRALGRRIELQLLSELCRVAQHRDCLHIELPLIETDKNQPARDFAERTLGAFCDSSRLRATAEGTRLYRMTAEQLAMAVHESRQPLEDEVLLTNVSANANSSGSENGSADLVTMPQNYWPWELCQRIATDWNSVDKVLRKIYDEARARPELDVAYSPPRTEIERQVVELCQSVLNVVPVGIHDGLKSLGASSLHIVQIYSRLEQTFHAGLSITDLFALPTIAAIIDRVEKTKSTSAANGVDFRTKPQVKQRNSRSTGSPVEGIAIIGMAGRFPGAANVREFWSNITAGVCSIVDIPDADLNLPQDSPLRNNPNLVRKSASVKDADKFDAKFFGIFPKEATLMDPQHRLLLENCWHAIEDAGYNVDAIDGPVGVFAGCYMDTYMLASLALSPKWLESLANAFHGGDLLTELGNDKDYLATRVSFLLNLRGPALTVQSACSTSLVAIAQACQSLVSGQCDMALAGGVTLKLPQNRGYLYTEGGMVSPDGVCRAFDAQARGTVFGEGCGVVLLKRVDDALADGDDIYAVIKGWGLNNDGHAKLSYTAPSVEGQAGAIAMAHRTAGIEADSITLIEAHGTGTSLGDPIEIESLSRVFRLTTDKRQYCAIGSLKTNVGHLDVAAGVAGLIKTSLALRNRVLPPSLNYEQPNPNIDFESSPFFVNTRLRDWETPFPRRAGLSSFGVGGTNAHLVIEEAPPLAATMAASPPQTAPQLILLSARSAAALDAQRLAIVQHLQDHPQLDMADVAFTLQTGRKTFNYSLAAVVNDLTQAIEVLREKPSQQVFEQRQVRRGKSVVFMFPGQGAQHLDMARDLYDSDKIFREVFDRCSELLLAHLGYDLREMVFLAAPDSTETAAERLNQTSVAQAAIFTVSYALAKRLQADGVLPSRMLGHSVGEFVAACLAGVFSLEEALRLIAFRAMHMQQLPTGSMLAVRMTEAEVLEKLPDELSLAAINGPQLCVVSGPSATVEQWQQKLEAAEVVCRRLHTSHAFHSAMMDPVVEPFAEQLRGVALRAPQLPIVSSVTGQPLTDAQAVDPNYWARHLRETVRFTDALAAITTDSAAVLLEVGPGQTLSTLARQHPGRNSEQSVLATLPHAKQSSSAREQLLLALGRLWQAGVDVDWKSR